MSSGKRILALLLFVVTSSFDAWAAPNVLVRSPDDALRLTDRLAAERGVHVSILHLAGAHPSPALETLMQSLDARGIPVEGNLVGPEDFDAAVAAVDAAEPAALVEPPTDPPTPPRRSFASLRAWARRVFGLPYGLTLVGIWVDRDAEGHRALRFPLSSRLSRLGVYLSGGAVGSLVAAFALEGRPLDARLLAGAAVTAAITFTATLFLRELSMFRLQGRAVVDVPATEGPSATGPPLVVRRNLPWFVTATFLQQLAVSTAILLAITPVETMGAVIPVSAPLNAGLTTFASLVLDRFTARLALEHEDACRVHDDARAAHAAHRVGWVVLIWGNIILPAVRMLHLAIQQDAMRWETWLSTAPFLLAGTLTLVFETRITGSPDTIWRRTRAKWGETFRRSWDFCSRALARWGSGRPAG